MIVKELFARLGLDVDEGAFKAGEAALKGLNVGMAAVGAVVAGTAAALAYMVRGVAESTVEAGRAAQRAGITQDAYEKLAFAAEATGIAADTMGTGLARLSRNVYGASMGSQDARLAFSKLGISITGSNGKLKGADEVLGDVADRFAKMPDGVQKTALAMHLFGRGGAAMIPLLNKGRDAIRELEDTAASFGLVTSPQLREESEKLEQSQKLLGAAFRGLKIAIAGPLLRHAGEFTLKLAEWIRLNREFIGTKLGDAFEFVRARLADLKNLLTPAVELINAIFIQTGAWKYALVALGVSMAVLLAITHAWLVPLILVLGILEEFKAIMEGRFEDTLLDKLFPRPVLEFIRDTLNAIRDAWKFLTSGGIGDAIAGWNQRYLEAKQEMGGGIVGAVGGGIAATFPRASVPIPGGVGQPPKVTINQTINSTHGASAKDIADKGADLIQDGLMQSLTLSY